MIQMDYDLGMELASGVLRLLTAGCILFRQILLEPDRPNYPNARGRLRVAMFVVGVALTYNGTDLIFRALSSPSRRAMVSGDVLSIAWFVVEALLLESLLRSWLPQRLQLRVQKWIALASCRKRDVLTAARAQANTAVRSGPKGSTNPFVVGAALAELSMAGVQVIGPNEPPSAVDWHAPGGPL